MCQPAALRLVPITQDQWMEAGLRNILKPGMEVKARIYKVRHIKADLGAGTLGACSVPSSPCAALLAPAVPPGECLI